MIDDVSMKRFSYIYDITEGIASESSAIYSIYNIGDGKLVQLMVFISAMEIHLGCKPKTGVDEGGPTLHL